MDSGDVSLTPQPAESVLTDRVVRRSCFTDQKMVKISFLWTITNYSICRQPTSRALLSSTFSAGEHKTTTWRLRLYPRGANEKCENYVALFLVSYNTRRVSAKAKFSIVDARNEDANSRVARTRIFSRRGETWGYRKFIGRMFLKQNGGNLLPNDTLTIRCEITALESSMCAPGTSSGTVSSGLPECRLSEDFEWLLADTKYADVTFKVGDEKFQAHRNILAARSSEFRAALEHPGEGATPGEIVIEDIAPEVFAMILKFLYTGRVPVPVVKPDALLKAANGYNIRPLKEACELALISGLSVDSAADTLILAEECNAPVLRNSTIDFICSNIGAVEKTAGWDTVRKFHAGLLERLVTSLTNKCGPPAKRARNL